MGPEAFLRARFIEGTIMPGDGAIIFGDLIGKLDIARKRKGLAGG